MVPAVLLLSASVSVAPNEGLVSAEIMSIEPSSVIGAPSLLLVRIISSQDVGDLTNFTRDKIGQSIDLHTKEDVGALKPGHLIQARVRSAGGRRGSLFWAIDVNRIEK